MKQTKKDKAGRLKRRTMRFLIHLLVWMGIAVLYYFIFSLFFDTPIEYEVRKSNRELDKQYQSLYNKYDSLLTVIDNVVERDKNVYSMLFESAPFDDIQKSGNVAYNDKLLSMTNNELAEIYFEKSESMIKSVTKETNRFALLIDTMTRIGVELNNIPSIQPVNNKELTKLAASYGMRIQPFHKTMTSHQGIDYAIPENTRIYSTADGVVSEVNNSSSQGQGINITIDHKNGYKSFYAHLNKVLVRKGEKVNRGDIIAYSGNTGLSFMPHLHYEIVYNGRRVDPINYFFYELTPYENYRLQNIALIGMQSLD